MGLEYDSLGLVAAGHSQASAVAGSGNDGAGLGRAGVDLADVADVTDVTDLADVAGIAPAADEAEAEAEAEA